MTAVHVLPDEHTRYGISDERWSIRVCTPDSKTPLIAAGGFFSLDSAARFFQNVIHTEGFRTLPHYVVYFDKEEPTHGRDSANV